MLKRRAQLYRLIRIFFADRGVLEVDTPVLSNAASCDVNLNSFVAAVDTKQTETSQYLQTSPEFAMKRLLAAGSGSIYQIAKSFRQAESGRFHNPEFTLLEWYRVGFDLDELIQEMAALLKHCFQRELVVQQLTYAELFYRVTNIDPHHANIQQLQDYAERRGNPEATSICGDRLADWLDYVFSLYIQPTLEEGALYFVTHYPECQSMLAKLNNETPAKALRFEVFIGAVELANGYQELTDAAVQKQRFEMDIAEREQMALTTVPMDTNLVEALESGLPECSGVALGLDRLLMLMTGASHIDEVLSFPIQRA